MTISVVIATHNRATLLNTALERLRGQEFQPGDEVVVVDNASTDRTADVITRAAEVFPVRLRGVYEKTPGKTSALNRGLAAAGGDILALTDDDVRVGDDWIATIRSLFSDPTAALVGGRVDPDWECEAPSWLRVEDAGQYGRMTSPLALLHYGDAQELGVRSALGANMVLRRSVLETLGGFAPDLTRRPGTLLSGEDHDFCERAVAAGYRCEYRPELRVRHRVPAERLRMRYFLRWFFWSGITQAMIDQHHPNLPKRSSRSPARHYIRRLAEAPPRALRHAVRGRMADAAAAAVDGAFAAGYLMQHARDRRGSQRTAETMASGVYR